MGPVSQHNSGTGRDREYGSGVSVVGCFTCAVDGMRLGLANSWKI
jgi:hypothetical protein